MASWVKSEIYPGVRYREHETRTIGIGKHVKPDRYITIFYKLDGKMVQEVCGWASKGITEKKANATLAELQENQRAGVGPRTLKEKRDQAETARKAQEAKEQEQVAIEAQAAIDNQTLTAVFYDQYLPQAKQDRRSIYSWKREESLFRIWIEPIIGARPLKDVDAFHLEKTKKAMKAAGKAPRSIQYMLAVVRQVFALCYKQGSNPAGKAGGVKRQKFDNKRTRYLTRLEAEKLLAELATVSQDVHDIALLSLHTGMRAGEIFNLAWANVDFNNGVLMLKDTKSSKNRPAYMTGTISAMLKGRGRGNALVVPNAKGEKITQLSSSFDRAVKTLSLNDGITDRLNKVTFHTLRHTFASWLVENGTDLYYIKELLGHSTIALTERYAHIGDNALRAAVQRLEAIG
jgi:integrase